MLKSIQKPTELKKYAGQTLGVDAYVWLHRGAIACAVELAQGKPTRKHVDYAMHRVRMLKHFGVTPYLVFDGGYLPSKAATERSRAKRREESKKLGMELIKAGKPAQAYAELQKAIDITPEMARQLIEELKRENIPYVVAPYEADAQLVYLERQGLISGIISEDSDLLVFGAKRLLTKLDQHGQCVEINRRDFCACREISLTGWSDAEFRQMAILSGCDYLEGINNMGLKTAYRMLRKYKTVDRLVRMLQFDGKFQVSENYLAAFKQAELTFLHQRVFCPTKQEMVLLTEPDSPVDVENMPFIGAPLPADVARGIAVGDLHPVTKQPLEVVPVTSKRRLSHAPAPKTADSTPAKKPIETYFQGSGRIPLGEMDSNCFTVDPQRVAALTQNGLLPRVFPLPRPYLDNSTVPSTASRSNSARLLRRRTEPVTGLLNSLSSPQTSTQAARRRTAGPAARNSPNSETSLAAGTGTGTIRPPKKARLCEDAPLEPAADGDAVLQISKFFPQTAPKKSPPKAVPRAENFIPSDDSIEEALLSLPDIGSWHETAKARKGESINIYTEAEATLPTPEDSQETNTIQPTTAPPKAPLESTAIETPIRASIQQLSYNAAPRTRISHGLPTPSTGSSTASSSALLQSTILSTTPASSTKSPPGTRRPMRPVGSVSSSASGNANMPTPPSCLTPLQRLGAQALHRRVPPTATNTSIGGSIASSFGSPRSSSSAAVSFKKPRIPDHRRSVPVTPPSPESQSSFPIDASLVPLPRVDTAEVEALNRVDDDGRAPVAAAAAKQLDEPKGGVCWGSEDMLLGRLARDRDDEENQDGDDGGADDTEGGSGMEVKTALDLSRFLYA